jgi:SPP1 family predicted phage head-tail adaptor
MPWKTSAAQYKTRVTIQQPVETVNAISEFTQTWETYIERWAEVLPSGGREFQAALSTNPMLQSIVRLRSDTETRAITPKMRISFNDRTLNIDAVFDERDGWRQVVIHCSEEPNT